MSSNQHTYTLSVILLLVIITIYVVTAFYAMPYADDFCFGWTNKTQGSLLSRYLHLYQNWNGRYTSDLLIQFHPINLNSLLAYQSIAVIGILLTVMGFSVFIYSITQKLKPAFLMGCTLAAFNLTLMPAISDCVYWFGGFINYHLGVILLLFHVALLVLYFRSNSKHRWAYYTASWLLLVAVVGIHELAALIVTSTYFVAVLSNRTSNRKRIPLLTLFITAVAGLLIVLLAPGNAVRSSHFSNQHNLLHSLMYSGAQMVRFGFYWIVNPAYILLACLTIKYGKKFIRPDAIQPHLAILLTALCGSWFLAFFLPYFATGMLGQHRTAAFAFAIFIPTSLLLIVYYNEVISSISSRIKNLQVSIKVFSVAMFFSLLFWGNTFTLTSDFVNGHMIDYKKQFMQRQQQILENPEAPIQPLKTVPATFKIADTKGDTTYWVDICMKNFYQTTHQGVY